MRRRTFLKRAGAGAAALGLSPFTTLTTAGETDAGIRGIGVCDWSIGQPADPSVLKKVHRAELDAVQVSVGASPDSIPLRKPSVRKAYRRMSEKYDVAISSVAAGGILNRHALFAEPQSAVFAVDAIQAAGALGAGNVLLAFFGNGELRKRDDDGSFIDQSDGPYSSYKLKANAVDRLVAVLKQLAPHAEKAGVDIGLENTLSARQNVDIMERVGSDRVKVYYDMGNSWHFGYNVPDEIRFLGNDRICEIHIKDRGENTDLRKKGEVDFNAVSNALHDIKYDGWLVLETGGSLEDYRQNGAYAREVFGVK